MILSSLAYGTEACAGTITVEELRGALKQNGRKVPESETEALLANVDLDKSGAIDYEEFLAATLHASKIQADEHLQRAFAEFDTDGSGAAAPWRRSARSRAVPCCSKRAQGWYEISTRNVLAIRTRCPVPCTASKARPGLCDTGARCPAGTISSEELQQALSKLGGYVKKDVDDVIQKVDVNQDGQIDYKEFVDMMRPGAEEPVRRRHQAIKF